MRATKIISRIFHKFAKLQFNSGQELPKKAVIIGAPHTSYWDGIYMAMGLWEYGRKFKFLVKDSAVNSPFGPIIKAVGGLAVERSEHHGLVDQIVAEFDKHDEFLLIITPKGTRSPRDFWKSGFYHIAHKAGVPVVLGYIDSLGTKTYGWNSQIELTGDMKADMEKIRAFYADKSGIKPEWQSVPRLRGEE